MEEGSIEKVLAGHPFLAGMGSRQVRTLAGCASRRSYAEGQHVTREGAAASELYLIDKGRVTIETRIGASGSVRLETLYPGDVLGWSSLMESNTWLFDSRTLTPVTVVVLDGDCLHQHCEADHQLGYELLLRIARVIEHRLQATRLQLIDVQHA